MFDFRPTTLERERMKFEASLGEVNAEFGLIENGHVSHLVELLRATHDGIVVELGCAFLLSETKTKWAKRYCALDKGVNLLLQAECLPNVLRVRGDAKHLPFPGSCAHLVIALGLFGALDDYDARPAMTCEEREIAARIHNGSWPARCQTVAREVERILVPGGTFLISNSSERQPAAEFVGFLDGFSRIEVIPGRERYLAIATKESV